MTGRERKKTSDGDPTRHFSVPVPAGRSVPDGVTQDEQAHINCCRDAVSFEEPSNFE